jgi:phosphohistidine phosphatase SixA
MGLVISNLQKRPEQTKEGLRKIHPLREFSGFCIIKIPGTMRSFLIAVWAMVVFTSCSHTIYIVRHAEKATQTGSSMSSDVPLTDQGKARATALRELLADKKIAYVYSTNTLRTRSTAQPTADFFHLEVQTYGPKPDSGFAGKLRSLKKNVLVVGHSNTVDDMVNLLCGKTMIPGDLPDSVYNKLLIVRIKGKMAYFSQQTFEAR